MSVHSVYLFTLFTLVPMQEIARRNEEARLEQVAKKAHIHFVQRDGEEYSTPGDGSRNVTPYARKGVLLDRSEAYDLVKSSVGASSPSQVSRPQLTDETQGSRLEQLLPNGQLMKEHWVEPEEPHIASPFRLHYPENEVSLAHEPREATANRGSSGAIYPDITPRAHEQVVQNLLSRQRSMQEKQTILGQFCPPLQVFGSVLLCKYLVLSSFASIWSTSVGNIGV